MAYHDLILSESGLQHYYRCNETSGSTLADSKGSETLTAAGTYALNSTPAIAGSLSGSFDTTGGTTGYAVNTSHTQIVGIGDFSFECWFNTTTTSDNIFFMGEGRTTSGTPYTHMSISSTKLRGVARNDAGTSAYIYGNTVLNDGKNHHLVFTGVASTSTMSIYVDGKSDATPVATLPATPYTYNNFALACLYRTGASNFSPVKLSHAATYNVALSSTIILNHYQAGVAGKMAFAGMF